MALLAPLVPFLCWMIWSSQAKATHEFDLRGSVIFLATYLILVLAMGLWGRLFARRIAITNLELSLRRFNTAMLSARLSVLIWFPIGLFYLNWGHTVLALLGPLGALPLELPPAILATLPVLLAWAGLFWAQFPADRSLREQSLLLQLESDLPVQMPPTFWRAFIANLRLRVLFTVVPVLLVLFVRDIATLIMHQVRPASANSGAAEFVLLAASLVVFGIAPEALRFVLHTQSLPDGALRERLERLCRANRIRYRDILLWRTDQSVGNAAVMGVLPFFRYVLLSDLLIATMTDEQIEAVFAHEAGHIKNHHIAWYLVMLMTMVVGLSGPISWLESVLVSRFPRIFDADLASIIVEGIFIVCVIPVFGLVMRRFERQADVYAAKWMQKAHSAALLTIPNPSPELVLYANADVVGQYGTALFNSALRRVSLVNNIPIHSRNFTHGSIASRMQFLQALSLAPERTITFEQMIKLVKLCIVLALLLGAGLAYSMRAHLFGGQV